MIVCGRTKWWDSEIKEKIIKCRKELHKRMINAHAGRLVV